MLSYSVKLLDSLDGVGWSVVLVLNVAPRVEPLGELRGTNLDTDRPARSAFSIVRQ
jgi:hypothetical protein